MVSQIVLTVWDGPFLRAVEADAGLQASVGEANRTAKGQRYFGDCGDGVRDRAELEPIRQQFELETSLFITESGSGIFTPVNHNPFDILCWASKTVTTMYMNWAAHMCRARAALRVLANAVSHPLKGFGGGGGGGGGAIFTVPKLERFMAVPEAVAHRAKAREFSEPFV